MGFDARTARSRGINCVLMAAMLAGLLSVGLATPAGARPNAARAESTPIQKCRDPGTPGWFHDALVAAIRVSKDLDPRWAGSRYIPKIICWQGTGFRKDFKAKGGPLHVWHGMFAMTIEEMQTIYGAWMTRTRNAFRLRAECFVRGWDACEHAPGNTATAQQLIAGLRWIWL